MAGKESSLIKIWDGDKLIGLVDGCNTAVKQPLDDFEREVLKMFNENKQFRIELDKLKEFARKIIKDECWDMQEPDGGDTQDLAEKLSLIKPTTATAEDVDDFSDFEVGDTIFKFTDILKESE